MTHDSPTDCAFCGCPVEAHEPVFVSEVGTDGTRTEAGAYCNYACLAAHIETAGLTTGATCEIDV
jgi:hypothetical protein